MIPLTLDHYIDMLRTSEKGSHMYKIIKNYEVSVQNSHFYPSFIDLLLCVNYCLRYFKVRGGSLGSTYPRPVLYTFRGKRRPTRDASAESGISHRLSVDSNMDRTVLEHIRTDGQPTRSVSSQYVGMSMMRHSRTVTTCDTLLSIDDLGTASTSTSRVSVGHAHAREDHTTVDYSSQTADGIG